MALPEGFNPSEHLQDTIKKVYNEEVMEWFSDINTTDPDISTPRGSLRLACTHLENDSMMMTQIRMNLFDFVIRERFNQDSFQDRDLNNQVLRRHKPTVTLYFLEDLQDVEKGYQAIKGTISFRLMHETTTTFTKANAQTLANKIKAVFCTGNGFIWKKGKEMCSYSDWEKGYQLQLFVRNEAEGKRIVERVLELQDHTPDWEFFNHSVNGAPSQAYPTVPKTETILGKPTKLPRRRPIASVRFQYAYVKLQGVGKPYYLIDRSGRYPKALVTTYRR